MVRYINVNKLIENIGQLLGKDIILRISLYQNIRTTEPHYDWRKE